MALATVAPKERDRARGKKLGLLLALTVELFVDDGCAPLSAAAAGSGLALGLGLGIGGMGGVVYVTGLETLREGSGTEALGNRESASVVRGDSKSGELIRGDVARLGPPAPAPTPVAMGDGEMRPLDDIDIDGKPSPSPCP